MKKHKHIIVFICMMLCLLSITGFTDKAEKEETETSEEEIVEESLVKTVEFDGKQVDYIRFGNKDGNTLVILPGLSLKSVMGAAEAIVGAYSLLAEDHEIYLFDHIREEPEGYGIDDMAEDTLKAFDLLGLEHVDLMGVSMGGMVAQTIALKRNDVVDSLILCSTTSNVKGLDHAVFENWKKLAEERDVNGL
ncbi:MAG: alpha/beta hydrolase, partial [Firmicutes bacterium]|nr:alpha/beta hydrolase [Bacillota bacterium]